MGTLISDILILLASAKVFFDLAHRGLMPQGLFVVGSIFIAFVLGMNMPIAKQVIREGVSAVVIILYLAYFFYLKKYGAPGGALFDLYVAFAVVLLAIYLFGRVMRIFWLVILAFAAAVLFGYLSMMK